LLEVGGLRRGWLVVKFRRVEGAFGIAVMLFPFLLSFFSVLREAKEGMRWLWVEDLYDMIEEDGYSLSWEKVRTALKVSQRARARARCNTLMTQRVPTETRLPDSKIN